MGKNCGFFNKSRFFIYCPFFWLTPYVHIHIFKEPELVYKVWFSIIIDNMSSNWSQKNSGIMEKSELMVALFWSSDIWTCNCCTSWFEFSNSCLKTSDCFNLFFKSHISSLSFWLSSFIDWIWLDSASRSLFFLLSK